VTLVKGYEKYREGFWNVIGMKKEFDLLILREKNFN
jgi:hypothetical protein